jgi:hypothetical protein
MTPEERELLFRIDERVGFAHERHQSCVIPAKVSALERKIDRIEGGIALLVILVTLGRFYDYYGPYLPHFMHNLSVVSLQTLCLRMLQLSNLV